MPLTSKPFLLFTALALPLLVALLGFWQIGRAEEYRDVMFEQRAAIEAQLAEMAELPMPDYAAINTDIRFSADGNTYVGDLALSKMREAISGFDLVLAVADIRRVFPPVVLLGGVCAFMLGLAIILVALVLGRIGSRSRSALVQGFSVVRRLLPLALIALVLITAFSSVSAALFEIAPLLRLDNLGRGQAYVLAIAIALVALALITAWQALAQLRTISHLFEPQPYPLISQPIDRNAGPGLWQMVEDAAQRLGAPVPDTIAVGLAEGFFVISSPVTLRPGDVTVTGNTLHVPLGHLVFMQPDEVATVIGHELAHFAGEDTVYSQRFLPIYRGFSTSLDAVAAAGRARDGSLSFLAAPALALGYFTAERFHHAVHPWSRIREQEADRLSATLTSPDAAGRALLRHGATATLINDVANELWADPNDLNADAVPLLLAAAQQRSLDVHAAFLQSAVPHPADSHPDNRSRLQAFGFDPTSDRIAAALTLPADAGVLSRYFTDPAVVSRSVTQGFMEASRRSREDHREALQATASAVAEEPVELTENTMPIAIMTFVMALPMLAGAAWTGLFGLSGFGAESIILAVAFAASGGLILLFGLQARKRARMPSMRLFPDRFEHVQLDQPIRWTDLRDVSVANHAGTMVTTFLLKRSAVFPKRVGFGGRGRIILNPAASVVTIRSVPPRHYKAAGYTELISRYAHAAAARSALANTADPSAKYDWTP